MPRNKILLLSRFTATIILASAALLFCRAGTEELLTVTTTLDRPYYRAGDTVIIALECDIAPQHHLYANPLGPGIGKPLRLSVTPVDKVHWFVAYKTPAIRYQPGIDQWVWAYEKKAAFFIAGVLPRNAPAKITCTVKLTGLICRTACRTFSRTIPISLHLKTSDTIVRSFASNPALQQQYQTAEPMAFNEPAKTPSFTRPGQEPEKPRPEWDYSPSENATNLNVWLALLLAFVAGIVLNVMPCVLPVLGIKILSLTHKAPLSRRATWMRSLAFAGGMLAVFLLLASLAAFAGFSWGQQFQKPAMLAAIIALIVVFGLGMLDVYMIIIPSEIIRLPSSMVEMNPDKKGTRLTGEFFKGVFTTIIATPCSGPFLGATLAWTLRQPPLIIYLVFMALGIGMATPYILFSVITPLRSWIPKPGPWMEDLKHVMGFLLFGFGIYLMRGLPGDMIVPTISVCLAMAFSAAVYGRFAGFGAPKSRKFVIGLAAFAMIALGWIFSFIRIDHPVGSAQQRNLVEPQAWLEFTPRLLTNAHLEGRSVLIDFTAHWCWNCQYNKIMVLNSKEIDLLLKKKGVLLLRADFTMENPEAESLLNHLGSRSIPFMAIFPGDDPYRPIILRDILEKSEVIRALKSLPERDGDR
jgi:thiol:disulfide interchange protein